MEQRANYGWGSSIETFVDADKRNIRQQSENTVREPSQAALDQVDAYARDLRAYHSACAGADVIPVLVPTDGRRGDLRALTIFKAKDPF